MFDAAERRSERGELAIGNRGVHCASHQRDVRFQRRGSGEDGVQEHVVAARPPGGTGTVHTAPHSPEQARRDGTRPPHLFVRVRQRIHLLERVTPLDAYDLLRPNGAWRDGQEQHERREHAGHDRAPDRVPNEKPRRDAEDGRA